MTRSVNFLIDPQNKLPQQSEDRWEFLTHFSTSTVKTTEDTLSSLAALFLLSLLDFAVHFQKNESNIPKVGNF